MTNHVFQQVDVFTTAAFGGNPLAVIVGADRLTDQQMASIANWTNLSETTFLLSPVDPNADYRVRIFTPERELPFAGHPTLGSCHVWLTTGGAPKKEEIVQECGVGLVRIRRDGTRLAFAAPPTRRGGNVEPELLARLAKGLRINASLAQWLIPAGLAPERYVASQGTVIGRAGRVHIARIGDDIWIGGDTLTCIEGAINV